jgi:hypothetical protein
MLGRREIHDGSENAPGLFFGSSSICVLWPRFGQIRRGLDCPNLGQEYQECAENGAFPTWESRDQELFPLMVGSIS